MTDLTKALAELCSVTEGPCMGQPWKTADFTSETTGEAFASVVATILNAALSGTMIPRADAELAVAEAIRRAADVGKMVGDGHYGDEVHAAIHRIAPAEALAEVQQLRKTYDELYQDALADAKSDAQDFDSDLWKVVRAYLDELNLDWRDYSDDGITADEVLTHIRECMNEETRRAEAAEADITTYQKIVADMTQEAEAAEAELAALRAQVEKMTGDTFYIDCEFDGHNGPLLSIAMVRGDGRGLHVKIGDHNAVNDPWVRENVIPIMDSHHADLSWHVQPNEAGTQLRGFIGDCQNPKIIADSPVDIARFCRAISTAEDGGWHSSGYASMTLIVRNVDCYPTKLEGAVQHNAWWDAMALRALLAELEAKA